MTTILARKKNGKKCQSVTGFKNVEGVLSKHLNRGLKALNGHHNTGFERKIGQSILSTATA